MRKIPVLFSFLSFFYNHLVDLVLVRPKNWSSYQCSMEFCALLHWLSYGVGGEDDLALRYCNQR